MTGKSFTPLTFRSSCPLSYLFAIAIAFLFRICFAEDIIPIPEFVKDDNVLILAPHPADDESISTAGVIQRALKSGARVKVVCFTNGDHNQLSFIVYEKRLTVKRGEFLHMGEVRRKEAIAAVGSLGLSKDNVIFMGYPDSGTMEILTKYWGNTKPYRSLLTIPLP